MRIISFALFWSISFFAFTESKEMKEAKEYLKKTQLEESISKRLVEQAQAELDKEERELQKVQSLDLSNGSGAGAKEILIKKHKKKLDALEIKLKDAKDRRFAAMSDSLFADSLIEDAKKSDEKNTQNDKKEKDAKPDLNTCEWSETGLPQLVSSASCDGENKNICVGYVKCKRANGGVFTRPAVCSEKNCTIEGAVSCAKEPGFGSRDPQLSGSSTKKKEKSSILKQ